MIGDEPPIKTNGDSAISAFFIAVIVLVTPVLFLIFGPSVFSSFFAISRDNMSIHALARKGDSIGINKLLVGGDRCTVRKDRQDIRVEH